MKIKVFNDNNLRDEDIDEKETRVKVFMVNDKNEVLTAFSGGGVQLIGGHVEDGETLDKAIMREVLEETGIDLSFENVIGPFYEVVYYTLNFKKTLKNRLSNVLYYFVRTNQSPDFSKIELTAHETERGFEIKWIPINDLEECVKKFLNNEKEINRVVANEILLIFNELQEKKYFEI